MFPEHWWGHPVPQGPDLRAHLVKILPVPQEKLTVTTKGTCVTGPVPAAGEQRVFLTKANENHSLQQRHAKLGPGEGGGTDPQGSQGSWAGCSEERRGR